MNSYLVTFGQIHLHRVNGKIFDKDTVGRLKADSHEEARERVFEIFGDSFFTTCDEKTFDESGQIKYFPKGKVDID